MSIAKQHTHIAITVRQPWAFLIVAGIKDIENRSWPTKRRGRVLIHAAKAVDIGAYGDLCRDGVLLPPIDNLPRQAVVGSVIIDGCVDHSDSEWFCGPWGFQLRDAIKFDSPIPCVGRLGFFNLLLHGDYPAA